jgi:hypothetical protein
MSRSGERPELAAELILLRTQFCRRIDQILSKLAATQGALLNSGESNGAAAPGLADDTHQSASPRSQFRRTR